MVVLAIWLALLNFLLWSVLAGLVSGMGMGLSILLVSFNFWLGLVWECWLTRWGWCEQASLVVGLAMLLALLNFLLMAPWAAWVAGVGTGLTMLLVLLIFSFFLAVWVVWVMLGGLHCLQLCSTFCLGQSGLAVFQLCLVVQVGSS